MKISTNQYVREKLKVNEVNENEGVSAVCLIKICRSDVGPRWSGYHLEAVRIYVK